MGVRFYLFGCCGALFLVGCLYYFCLVTGGFACSFAFAWFGVGFG